MKKESKNPLTRYLFHVLVTKHANGNVSLFAKAIGVKPRWVYDKCSGREGLPSEKLFEILSKLGYKNLNELDFIFSKKYKSALKEYKRKDESINKVKTNSVSKKSRKKI